MTAETTSDFINEPGAPRTNDTEAHVAGATAILSLGNIASRVLGLVREQVITFLFGATAAADAFQIAILIPRTFYDLLIGGQVNGAIVPVLTEVATKEGRAALWRLVSVLISFLLTMLFGLVLVMQLFAPQLVTLTAGEANPTTQALAVDLLRITIPGLLFLGVFAVLSGTLLALKSFLWPALASLVFNGSIVMFTLLLAPPLQILLNPTSDPFNVIAIARPASGIAAAAIGWTLGALAQLALQLVGLRRSHIRLTLDWRNPALRRIILLYIPVMGSLLLDTVVVRFFTYNRATLAGGEGALQYMNLATTLIQFPQGLVATAISLAILPTLSEQSSTTNENAFRDTLGLGLRLTWVLIFPAMVGMFVLAQPIVMLLFERGAFTAVDTAVVVPATRIYLLGLPFAATDLLLVYAFYARRDTLTPALIGVASHSVYIAALLLLIPPLGLYAVMAADAIKHVTHATISAILLRRRLHGFGRASRLFSTLLRTLIATGIMGVVGWLTLPLFFDWIGAGNVLQKVLLLLTSGAITGGTFLLLAWLLRIEELNRIMRIVQARLRR
ncbi:murein biosynthesis integral membrane protein MurJ [Phototrophicus methaneseepsis]|uniref:Probable lipid II flippase MurJ n=1 Tax=Phototrophicus methaneseepsis TaxID=2710758 RepID=A0A7S8IF48_9CHLR|nr:murein biosynthesis integral membrane protein MurJ [Phototrophicus methaneseepsis]QPC82558.1 murein biosynthesis integral membrane protein MurJ [Phototrophicus methaneseepsis]